MCSRPPWSQPAESRVHQRSIQKTGTWPEAPNRNMLSWLGVPIENSPPIWMWLGSTTSIATYRKALPRITAWTNPRSFPRPRTAEVSPHIPGRLRPQLRQTSSLTPTSLPQEGQRTEPVRWRLSMAGLYLRGGLEQCLSRSNNVRRLQTLFQGLQHGSGHLNNVSRLQTLLEAARHCLSSGNNYKSSMRLFWHATTPEPKDTHTAKGIDIRRRPD